jgi:hypothetical protein
MVFSTRVAKLTRGDVFGVRLLIAGPFVAARPGLWEMPASVSDTVTHRP